VGVRTLPSVLGDARAVAKILANFVLVIFGVLLVLAAFFTKGMRPAFSQGGPWVPMTLTGRAILFVGGALVFIVGVHRLFK
jgi:hypothetical protein